MGFMAAHVEPQMKKVFVAHDADGFSDFGCETCHGADMEVRDFAMPNDLYALAADDPMADAMDYDEELAEFMAKKVLPTLAQLLSKKTGVGGASCFTCHPKDE